MNGVTAVQWTACGVFACLWSLVGLHDWRFQKVGRRYLAAGAAATAAGYAVLLGLTVAGIAGRAHTFHYWSFYGLAAAAAGLCALAAIVLWQAGVWPAGDAKLFILLACLYPLMVAASGRLRSSRLFLDALINTFLPACAALFVRAALYIGNSRLRHARAFLIELGWRREASFLAQRLGEVLGAGAAKTLELLGTLRSLGSQAGRKAMTRPALAAGARWAATAAASIFVMSLLSYEARGFLTTPLLSALLWTGLFLLWQKVRPVLGPVWSNVFKAVGLAALLLWRPPTDWAEVGRIFGSISIFSLFLGMGIGAAARLMSGKLEYALAFVVPLLGFAAGLVLMAAQAAIRQLRPVGRSLLRLSAATPSVSLSGLQAPSAAGLSAPPWLATLLMLAVFGLFFGLCLMMVRLWDEELRPYSPVEELHAYLVVAPAFLEEMRQDEEFFGAHFAALYPDGLTKEQAEALKGWCRQRGVEKVPLVPTVSFAFWIFFGFFAARLLGGSILAL